MIETFIARRLGAPGRKGSVMLRVATLCVTVSVAVMLVALGVVNGFRGTIGEKVAGFAADIRVAAAGGGSAYEAQPVEVDSALIAGMAEVEGVARIQRFATKTGVIRGEETIQGIVLRGMAPESDTMFLHRQLVSGRIPVYTDSVRSREAVVSRALCDRLGLRKGDRFEALFMNGEVTRRDRFRVAAIYDSGMEEFDRTTVFCDMGVVQRLNGWRPDQVGGYEVAVAAASDRAAVAEALTEAVGGDDPFWLGWSGGAEEESVPWLEVTTVEERYPQIFDWLGMLGLNTTLVIVIMLVVAVVNMASGVLILVLEQTRTIGILKALGMRNGMLQRIFVWRSAGITLRGLLWGDAVGLVLCLLQQYTGWVTLDPESYMMAAVPVRIDWMQVLWLNVGTLVVVTAAMGLPTAIIARMSPEKSIRFR
ncbi:FtsX-like permease family protein [uncultured Rikenella sp.]|uniref:ABC transporter permease n=1 Tax=uncultured Rikenella sp. TaxID=368003 RepID=UPI0026003259|nr:FtsX-like permease family protein [uncultured Rikenella sp.]